MNVLEYLEGGQRAELHANHDHLVVHDVIVVELGALLIQHRDAVQRGDVCVVLQPEYFTHEPAFADGQWEQGCTTRPLW